MNWYKIAKLSDRDTGLKQLTQCSVCRKWATLPDDYVGGERDIGYDYIYKDIDEMTNDEKRDWVKFKNSEHADQISHGICEGCLKSFYGYTDENIVEMRANPIS